MQKTFAKKPLWEVTQKLTAVAMGQAPAELVLRNIRLINVCTAEITEPTDIAVAEGRIAFIGRAEHCIGPDTRVIDGEGQYAAPGFLDGHIHIESSMLSAGEYGRAVIPHGTTGVYIDPHEICNVLGMDGIRAMIDDAARVPLKTMVTMPSCVPAVPGFEDTGAEITAREVAEAMNWPTVVGLGEMMNYPGILSGADNPHQEVAETLKAGATVTGHFPIPATEPELNGYVAAGIRCCHESTRAEDALAKARLGMYAQLREGSAWHDLHEVIHAVLDYTVDSRFFQLISDDTHPHTLMTQGHLDHIARRAVEEGLDPVTAIQMITINVAQCYHMDQDLGSLTPGKAADIVLMDDLPTLHVTRVFIDGDSVAENGAYTGPMGEYRYPAQATHSMHIKDAITPASFRLPSPGPTAKVHVMEIIPERVGTYHRIVELAAPQGLLESDVSQDVLKTAVFERHHETGKVGFGFTRGFHIQRGAMASTVAHDAHNLLVIGTNDEDMALAANTLIASGGGLCTVQDGKVLGHVPLPIAGLMSDRPLAEVAGLVDELTRSWEKIGCDIASPFMTMALIPLACLPELRLTDRGLVDCTCFRFLPLIAD